MRPNSILLALCACLLILGAGAAEGQAIRIEAMEVYHGGATTPAEWRSSSSACGVIVVWTKH